MSQKKRALKNTEPSRKFCFEVMFVYLNNFMPQLLVGLFDKIDSYEVMTININLTQDQLYNFL